MVGSIEVNDYMLKNPVTARPELTVYEAALRILDHKVSGLVVVDERKALMGMLSELDCLRVILAGVYNDEEFGAALVGDVMTREVEVHHPHDDIVDVATSMLDHKHRRRPVVHEGLLVGQLTCRQILKILTEGLKDQNRR